MVSTVSWITLPFKVPKKGKPQNVRKGMKSDGC